MTQETYKIGKSTLDLALKLNRNKDIVDAQLAGIGDTVQLYAYVNGALATPVIYKSSSNVTSLTDSGLGIRTVNCNALASALYSAVASGSNNNSTNVNAEILTRTTTAIGVATAYASNTRIDWDFSLIVTGA